MINCNTCIVGITFLLSSIYLSILKQDNDIFFKFNRLLNDKQQVIYQNIVRERLKIYTIAMFTGLGSGLLYWYRNQNQPYIWCTFLAIAYIVKLGVYYFYPKSPLMLYSLTTKEQTDAWADIYTEMKTRYRISLLIGFIGYLIISSGLK
jgi:hypothetical protein